MGNEGSTDIRLRLLKSWINHPALDVVVVAVVVGSFAILRLTSEFPADRLGPSGRLTWLETLTGVSGALLGLEIAAVSIIYAVTPGPRLDAALRQVGPDLTKLLVSCLAMLAICTGLFVVAMPFYGLKPVSGVTYVVIGALMMTVCRTSRLLWLFQKLLTIFANDVRIPPDSSDESASAWVRPEIEPGDYPVKRRRAGRGQP